MTSLRNFAKMTTPTVIDDAYERCNFKQVLDHTRIFPGDDTPRTFIRCNMTNCVPPPGSTLDECRTGHYVRDPANDVVVEIDGQTIVVEEVYAWSPT